MQNGDYADIVEETKFDAVVRRVRSGWHVVAVFLRKTQVFTNDPKVIVFEDYPVYVLGQPRKD